MPALTVRRFAVACISLLLFVPPLFAQRQGGGRSGPGTGNPDEHLVPWKYLPKNGELIKQPIVLYWLPASQDEVKRSSLLTSRALLEANERCVGLQIVVPDDAVTIEKLGATGKLPMAILTDAQGRVIRSVSGARGNLALSAVEQALAQELRTQDDVVFRQLTEARTAASNGDTKAAIDLYTKIWDNRCLYPLVGSEAQHRLKDLGVTVHETPAPPPADPNLKVTMPSKRH